MKRRAVIFAAGCGATAFAAVAMKPRQRAAEVLPPIDLEKQIPQQFGEWRLDRSIVPVLPSPDVQALLTTIYNQTLARTYVDATGQRVMLSIAYGSDQGTDATAAHRPEFCYTAQGFSVRGLGETDLVVAKRHLVARRLIGSMSTRIEPITYWVTLNDSTVLPGIGRKLLQIRLGLAGQIPDGMLVRVSNISNNRDASFALHAKFLDAVAAAMPPGLVNRYFGNASA